MHRRFTLAALAVLLAFFGVAFWASNVFAQDYEVYIPLVTDSESLGTFPEIQQADCERLGLAVSRQSFENGTSIVTIANKYHMFAMEIKDLNREFLSNTITDANLVVIDSVTGRSPVCLYNDYDVSYFPHFAGTDEAMVIKWLDGVPDWQDNIVTNLEVVASQAQTETTYTVLFGLIAIDSAWGAPVVGELQLGGKTIGQIVKGIPSSALRFMGNAVSGFVLLDALYDRISTATTLGVEYSATVLTDDGAGIFYGTQQIPWAYFGCFADGTDIYENLMARSEAVQMYTTGPGKEACVIARVPLTGEMGGFLYQHEVLHATALNFVAERVAERKLGGPTTPIKESEVKAIAEAFIQWFETKDDDPKNDPIVPPPDPNGECPRISDETHHVQEAVLATVVEVEIMLRNATADEVPMYNRLIDFANWAQFEFVEFDLADRYMGKRPRNGNFEFAHLTSEPYNAGVIQGTAEMVCVGRGSVFVWLLNSLKGRLRTAITSQIWGGEDFEPAYQNLYED